MRGPRMEKAKVIGKRKFGRRYPGVIKNNWRCVNMSFEEWAEGMEKRMRKTGTPCSCPMCGNQRKWFGARTIQEKRLG